MSDHPNSNLHRGDGVSGRTILVALLVILGIIALLAVAGSFGDPEDSGLPAGEVIAPAAETAPVPTQ